MWRAVTFSMTTWRTMQNIMFSIVLFMRIKFGGMDAKQCPSLPKWSDSEPTSCCCVRPVTTLIRTGPLPPGLARPVDQNGPSHRLPNMSERESSTQKCHVGLGEREFPLLDFIPRHMSSGRAFVPGYISDRGRRDRSVHHMPPPPTHQLPTAIHPLAFSNPPSPLTSAPMRSPLSVPPWHSARGRLRMIESGRDIRLAT